MSFSAWLNAFIIFFLSLFTHVAIWRARKPKNDIGALFLIFFGMSAAAYSIEIFARSRAQAAPHELTFVQLFASCLLYYSLACAYIQSYPAAQAESPSLKMLIFVGRRGPHGVSFLDLENAFDDQSLLEERFHDLVNTRLIYRKDGLFYLTRSGAALAKVFNYYRAMLGLELGEG